MKDDHDNVHDFDFDTWFDLFSDRVKKLGYVGPIDKATFEDEWKNNEIPETVAADFVSEMRADDYEEPPYEYDGPA